METLISVADAAEKWNITPRRVQMLCNNGRIAGVIKQSGIWLIPKNSKKPDKITPGKKSRNKKGREFYEMV